MKNTVCALLIFNIFLFCGCNTLRKTSNENSKKEHIEEGFDLDISKLKKENHTEFSKIIQSISGDKKITVTIYDTDKPVDKTTSRPPAIADIEIQSSIDIVSEKTDSIALSNTEKIDSSAVIEIEQDLSEKYKSKSETRSTVSFSAYIIIGIILAILIVTIVIMRKFRLFKI